MGPITVEIDHVVPARLNQAQGLNDKKAGHIY